LQAAYDAIVIGGGFYGCSLALALAPRFARILIVEREPELLMRASYSNQARVHNGYHYPRSLLTALRSAANYPVFLNDFRECIDRSFLHLYAIARGNSKVSAYQFRKFCQQVKIPLQPAPRALARLFNPALIEEVFAVEESTFDAVKLRRLVLAKLQALDIEVACGQTVDRIARATAGAADPVTGFDVFMEDERTFSARYVFSCTYSQTNRVLARSALAKLPLKHELAELALIQVPPELEKLGITVMDGPFFSVIPFSPLGLHTLSHVTYTPHESWSDTDESSRRVVATERPSKSLFMLKDAQRFLPVLREARYVRSLFETKTVLPRNEVDDGRPILCCRHRDAEGLFVILGAKIDNIYDIARTLDAEQFNTRSMHVASY